MISNLIWYLILRQLCSYKMLNRIVNPNNNLCTVCFSCIYQNNIHILSILRYHISSTNIFPHLFTLKETFHYITSIRIALLIQPHTHRLKWIISFSSHKSTIKENQNAKAAKNKILNCRNWTDIPEAKQISSWSYMITPKQTKIAETECKY